MVAKYDKVKVSGDLALEVLDDTGVVRESRYVPNLVVSTGLALIINRLLGAGKAAVSHMAVGISNQATAASDTGLIQQAGAREPIDTAVVAGPANNWAVYTCTFEAGDGTGALTEAGVFNADTGGDMLCRTVFPVVNKLASDSMVITWTIKLDVGA